MKKYFLPILIGLYLLFLGLSLTSCGQKGELIRPTSVEEEEKL